MKITPPPPSNLLSDPVQPPTLFLVGTYTIGKERILEEIVKQTSERVYASSRKLELFRVRFLFCYYETQKLAHSRSRTNFNVVMSSVAFVVVALHERSAFGTHPRRSNGQRMKIVLFQLFFECLNSDLFVRFSLTLLFFSFSLFSVDQMLRPSC